MKPLQPIRISRGVDEFLSKIETATTLFQKRSIEIEWEFSKITTIKSLFLRPVWHYDARNRLKQEYR